MIGSELIIPVQKWDTGNTDGFKRQKSPFWKPQRHRTSLWRIPVSNRKWKIEDEKMIYAESQTNTSSNNTGNTRAGFQLTHLGFASIAFILEVYFLRIFSLLFLSSHAIYINIVTISLVCSTTASLRYFPALPFLDHHLSHGSCSARVCRKSTVVSLSWKIP